MHSSRKGLRLGPVVGHTDDKSSIVWIRVYDDPSRYSLHVEGRGHFSFQGTEKQDGPPQLLTAVACADKLQPDRRYSYRVLRDGRTLHDGMGSFRTMPLPGSMSEMTIVATSCSAQTEIGLWPQLARFIEQAQPRCLLLTGDQVYLDDEPSVWDNYLTKPDDQQRLAMADKYDENWGRDEVRRVLANIPTYMLWDDHEIRDGWGSIAPDSPTMARQLIEEAAHVSKPRAEKIDAICQRYRRFYMNARHVYWHFQMSHNPRSIIGDEPESEFAWPMYVRMGRIAVLMVDGRGVRDPWRPVDPILGSRQWAAIDAQFEKLRDEPDVDALVVVTQTPLVGMDPEGISQRVIGTRTDDIELLRRADAKGLLELNQTSGSFLPGGALSAIGAYVNGKTGVQPNIGDFHLSDIDDCRDQWAYDKARNEQMRLLQRIVEARSTGRPRGQERSVMMLAGDLHLGARFAIDLKNPSCQLEGIVASGISKHTGETGLTPVIGILLDQDFEVIPGMHATLKEVVNDCNFAVIQMIPTGGTPQLQTVLVSAGTPHATSIYAK